MLYLCFGEVLQVLIIRCQKLLLFLGFFLQLKIIMKKDMYLYIVIVFENIFFIWFDKDNKMELVVMKW